MKCKFGQIWYIYVFVKSKPMSKMSKYIIGRITTFVQNLASNLVIYGCFPQFSHRYNDLMRCPRPPRIDRTSIVSSEHNIRVYTTCWWKGECFWVFSVVLLLWLGEAGSAKPHGIYHPSGSICCSSGATSTESKQCIWKAVIAGLSGSCHRTC